MTSRLNTADQAEFAVGLDIGTSSVKGAVITSAGHSFDYVSTRYATTHPQPDWAEQDPDDWWRAVGEVLDLIVAAHPDLNAANTMVGLTGQMHTTVIRDADGTLLRPAILWSDVRATDAAQDLLVSTDSWTDVAGNPPIPAFTSAHLRWLQDNEPRIVARAARVCVPKDDLRFRLGAGWATEPSDASAMNLMDARADKWDRALLEAVGIDESLLPPIVPSAEITGRVSALPPMRANGARLLGAPIVAGAADQAAQALALGAVADDAVAISIGTSGAAFQAIGAPRPGAFRHAVPATWLALDSTHAAGLSLEWWSAVSGRPIAGSIDAYREPADLPIFLPNLQGGRGGHGVPGTLTDLRATHGADDIANAVLEGVAIELVRLARQATLGNIPDRPIGVGGRAAKVEALRTLLAAGLDRPIHYSGRGPAYGAAQLAATAAGWWHRHLDNAVAEDNSTTTLPDPAIASWLAPRTARHFHLVDRLT